MAGPVEAVHHLPPRGRGLADGLDAVPSAQRRTARPAALAPTGAGAVLTEGAVHRRPAVTER